MRAHDPRNDLAITHSRCDSVAAEEQALRRHYGAGSPEAAALDSSWEEIITRVPAVIAVPAR